MPALRLCLRQLGSKRSPKASRIFKGMFRRAQRRCIFRQVSSRPGGLRGAALPGWRGVSWPFHGWPDCYMAFNDPPGELLHITLSLVRARPLHVDRLVSVAGSMTALNLLTVLSPRHIHFFDMNPCAVQWGKMLCELILLSETPQEFMSRLFARNLIEFERDVGKLTFSNQDKFLMGPVSTDLRVATQQALSHQSASVYCHVLYAYQDKI